MHLFHKGLVHHTSSETFLLLALSLVRRVSSNGYFQALIVFKVNPHICKNRNTCHVRKGIGVFLLLKCLALLRSRWC